MVTVSWPTYYRFPTPQQRADDDDDDDDDENDEDEDEDDEIALGAIDSIGGRLDR